MFSFANVFYHPMLSDNKVHLGINVSGLTVFNYYDCFYFLHLDYLLFIRLSLMSGTLSGWNSDEQEVHVGQV